MGNKEEIMKLGNLTLILNNNYCNKKCPFCIAKYSGKIYNKKVMSKEDEFEKLESIFNLLMENNFKFSKFVISGNGEPSLYEEQKLIKIIDIVNKYSKLFDGIRLHTNGSIFYNKKVFNMFNCMDNIEFDVLRISLDSQDDMSILQYNFDYINTEKFKEAKNVKMDIPLLKYINNDSFMEKLKRFITQYSSIKTIRFKRLLESTSDESYEQNKWINSNTLNSNEMNNIYSRIKDECDFIEKINDKYIYKLGNVKIIYGESGNYKYYKDDYVISNNKLMQYDEKIIGLDNINKIRR